QVARATAEARAKTSNMLMWLPGSGSVFCLDALFPVGQHWCASFGVVSLSPTCPNCREPFAEKAKFCSSCGYAFTPEVAAVGPVPTTRTPFPVGVATAPPAAAYDASTPDPLQHLNTALE